MLFKIFHFRKLSNGKSCFTEGTNFDISDLNCSCVEDYYGPDCGIPDSVWHGHFKSRPKEVQKLVQRSIPRRIIHAVPVNHEYDFFETRVKSLNDVVDAFIIQVGTSNSILWTHPTLYRFHNSLLHSWLHANVHISECGAVVWRVRKSWEERMYGNPMMTFPIRKRIITELFIYRNKWLYIQK